MAAEMLFFSRKPPPRQPHVEPGFDEAAYVAEYSAENRKHAGGDTRALCDFAAKYLRNRKSAEVLELGPGPGWIAIDLAQKHAGVRVTGVDVSPAFLAQAKKNAEEVGVGERVNFIQGDALHMPQFASAAFDLVVSHQSLHYWASPPLVFNEIARVLRSGGAFFISDDRRDLSGLGKWQVWLGLCALSRRIGLSWRESLRGCFTVAEVQGLLDSSALRSHWKLVAHGRVMYIFGTVSPP